MGVVVKLVDTKAIRCSDSAELAEWATSWLDSICKGDFGQVKTLGIIVESVDGQMGMVSQSITDLDRTRLVGLLTVLVHRKLDGFGNLLDMS